MGTRPHGPGDFANGYHFPHAFEPLQRPDEFVVHQGKFQSKSGWLGMDAVAAANAGRELVLICPPLDDGQKFFHVRHQQVGTLLHLHGVTGIADIAAGQAKMEPAAGVVIDLLRHGSGEGNHVMIQGFLQFALSLHQPGRIQLPGRTASLELREILAGNNAFLDQRLAGEELDIEPETELVFFRPNRPHFRARIARNHAAIKPETDTIKKTEMTGDA